MRSGLTGVVLVSLSFVLGGCDSSFSGRFTGKEKDAQALYSRVAGTDLQAMEELIRRSDEGDTYASLQVGYILNTGTGGIKKDYVKAAEFYKRAERLPVANYNLALLLVNDRISSDKPEEANIVEGIRRLQQAGERANKNFVLPLVTLGQIYERGLDVPINPEIAFSWYQQAASLGDALGMYKVGMMYLTGKGKPQNSHLAEQWLNNAADRWSTDAMLQLGLLLGDEDFQGYKPVAAGKWFYVAAITRPEFRKSKEAYFDNLSEVDQRSAIRLGEAWMKGHQVIPEAPLYNKPSNQNS